MIFTEITAFVPSVIWRMSVLVQPSIRDTVITLRQVITIFKIASNLFYNAHNADGLLNCYKVEF